MQLLYIFWDVDPMIFPTFEYLRWYGLCWALGVILSYQLMAYIYRKEGKAQQRLDSLAIYIMLGVVIGARLGHILFYDSLYYWQNPIEILPFKLEPAFEYTGLAGLASHGGVIGGLLALSLYCRKWGENFLALLDRLVVVGALLGCFIRLGNLMNSEIVGTPTDVPWAFVFSRLDEVPRHPAQLYEALFYLLLFVLLFSLWRRGKASYQRGYLTGLGLTAVFTQRFIIEFLKIEQAAFENYLPVNVGQLLSIPFIVIGILILLWSVSRSKKRPLTAN